LRANKVLKANKPKTAARREGIRRNLPRPELDIRAALQRPEVINPIIVGAVSAVICAILVVWSLATPKISIGQVATENRLVRTAYQIEDRDATLDKRDEARKGAPRIYEPNTTYLQRLRAGIEGLPRAVADRETLDGVQRELVEEFGLTDESVRLLQEFVGDSGGETWRSWVARFFDHELVQNPLLSSQEFQLFITTANREAIVPRGGGGSSMGTRRVPIDGEAISVDGMGIDNLRYQLMARARASGVGTDELASIFAAPMIRDPKPTLLFNDVETHRIAAAAAAAVPVVMREYAAGDRIFLRGDVLTEEQVARTFEEARMYMWSIPTLHRWLFRAGVVGSSALLIAILLGYLYVFDRSICGSPVRLIAMMAMLLGLTGVALAVAVDAPWLLRFAGTGACIIAAIILALAYGRQLAMFVSVMHCLITAMVLEQGVTGFLVLVAGCSLTIAQLREVRHRTALLRACALAALAMGLGTLLVGPLRMPPVPEAIWQVVFNAVWSSTACIAAGFVMLGVLPTLERICDITTGLTLAELRDPKQPLLRQLQQKAPGTYNHSLQIANISEAAAEAIGANGLLVYVGALYHDIGKMNKPDYFVENQAGGVNKHDRLSPAMSLLVIVGHVKDGIELAREYGLPRSIRHFIESHHGTTLVEYFYNAARNRAEAEGAGETSVDELAYRYPGPRPRTKEAAILMIADAVESATRALAEPTPSRIESVVRTLARKRLDDGQLNDSDLTLRELTKIEDSLIKSVCAIYHGRISYGITAAESSDDSTATSQPAPTPPSKMVAQLG